MDASTKKKHLSNFVRSSNSPSAPILPPGVPGELIGESKTNASLKTNQEELGQFSPRPNNNLSPMTSLSQTPNNCSPSAPNLPPGVLEELSDESKTNTNQEELQQFSPEPSNSLSPMSSLGGSPNYRSPPAPVLPSGVPRELSGERKTNTLLQSNQEELEQVSPTNSKNDDFTSEFLRIGNLEQRKVYKAEFNKAYNRYMIVHAKLDGISQRFSNLQIQLRHTPETSPDYLLLKKMVIKEYEAANTNQAKLDREEFTYLHKKLAHIKKLVHDYDAIA
jgi:hypothetical protein